VEGDLDQRWYPFVDGSARVTPPWWLWGRNVM